uniref:Signal recognition particle 19 kDa protein n=1 Tax=Electrophorus electricus TaxID=8005 RepID=A0A4W4E549_ELEEL
MAYLTSNSVDKERFLCIYPAYINSKKTLAEGRRIPTEKSVENPSCAEIRDVLTAAGMNVYNKMYPREWNRDGQFRGSVLCQDKFTSSKYFCIFCITLFYVAEIIPKLKTRTQKSGGGDSGAQPGEGRKKGKKKK